MKILVVEDEIHLAKEIKDYLKNDALDCDLAYDVSTALEKIHLYVYDCIVLDIGLPDDSGFKVLEELKAANKTEGVIIISAKDALEDRLKGIQIGADDYLTKPFHLAELAVRIMAIVRRKKFGGNNSVSIGDLVFNIQEPSVLYKNNKLNFTPTEFKILEYFISSPNKVLSKTVIAEHVLGEQSDFVDGHQLVYTHIKNMKRKLAKAGCSEIIQNVYAVGYKFVC